MFLKSLCVLLSVFSFGDSQRKLRGFYLIDQTEDWSLFSNFQEKFNRKYQSIEELELRFSIFRENLINIISHNMNENATFTMGINAYTDMTAQEFKKHLIGGYKHVEQVEKVEGTTCGTYSGSSKTVPSSFDWRSKNVVNPIRQQGSCGSCYTFSTMSALESAWAIKTGILYDVSEQQVVDCANLKYGDLGCNGGSITGTFNFAMDNKICKESEYPYTSGITQNSGTCQYCTGVISAMSCKNVPPKNQVLLKEAVSIQPVSVAIEADTNYFQSYSGGILTSTSCGTNLDHAVVVVGYGTEGTIDYWLVRNSWGTSWGEAGYFRILRTSSTNDAGICGIAMAPTFPIV